MLTNSQVHNIVSKFYLQTHSHANKCKQKRILALILESIKIQQSMPIVHMWIEHKNSTHCKVINNM